MPNMTERNTDTTETITLTKNDYIHMTVTITHISQRQLHIFDRHNYTYDEITLNNEGLFLYRAFETRTYTYLFNITHKYKQAAISVQIQNYPHRKVAEILYHLNALGGARGCNPRVR